MVDKTDILPDRDELAERYEVRREDKEFGPPNAERRGVRKILINSSIAAAVAMAIVGVWLVS